MWMCAAVALPVSFEKVSVHFSFLPLRVAWNAPVARVFLTVCFGISCAAVSLADQPIPRDAPSETAVTASAHRAAAASMATSFLTMSSLADAYVKRSDGARERFGLSAEALPAPKPE